MSEDKAVYEPHDARAASPTRDMNLAQRIAHVGGRVNADGYVEFGGLMAVNALVDHVVRDIDPEDCVWREDEDGSWDSDCGHTFEFFSETPECNGFAFCPYCGSRLEQQSCSHDAEESE